MQRTLVGLVAVSALLASITVAAAEEGTTIEWEGGTAAFGFGVSWGDGVLHYGGYDYPFSITGLDVADVGGAKVTGSGKVYNLTKPEELNGTYAGAGIGLTVAGGGSAGIVQNQNGIRIDLLSTGQGLRAWAGAGGINVDLPASSIRAVRALQAAEKATARSEEAARRAESGATRVEAAVERLEAALAQAESRHRRALRTTSARPPA